MADIWLIISFLNKKRLFIALFLRGSLFFFLVGLIFIVNSSGLHASSISLNSQNMFLLEPNLALDPNWSRGGGEVIVVDDSALLPEVGPLGAVSDFEGLPPGDRISIYVVRAGDTLSEIAEMFKVSVNTIMWANDLSRVTAIREGQILVILPVTGVQHTVVKGDTLQSLAKKYKADLEEIIRFNDLNSAAALTVGTTVIIPDGEVAAPPTAGQSRYVRGGGPSYAGYYLRPIRGGVKTQGLHGYNGVDLATAAGAPIYAAAAGRVIISKQSGWNGGYGNYIAIEHGNGTQTLYAHNQSNIVSVGQTVVQGQVIGYIGSTGKSTGPHVHFEIRGAKNPF